VEARREEQEAHIDADACGGSKGAALSSASGRAAHSLAGLRLWGGAADAALALEFVARSGDIEPPELVHHLHHLLAHAQFVTDTIASRQLL
jgi:hypothetical protein